MTTATVTAASVGLNWTDTTTGEDGFMVERKVGAAGAWVVVSGASPLAANTTAFTDNSAQAGTSYFYHVKAVKGTRNSPWSSSEYVVTPTS
jgi:large repetitive protein